MERGDAGAPASLNAFNYANGNPGLLLDPSGLAASATDEGGCGLFVQVTRRARGSWVGCTGNLAVTYLGSYEGRYSVSNGILEIRIHNESTIASATHPPVIGYTDWWQKAMGDPLNQLFATGPMSTTKQDIVLHQVLHR